MERLPCCFTTQGISIERLVCCFTTQGISMEHLACCFTTEGISMEHLACCFTTQGISMERLACGPILWLIPILWHMPNLSVVCMYCTVVFLTKLDYSKPNLWPALLTVYAQPQIYPDLWFRPNICFMPSQLLLSIKWRGPNTVAQPKFSWTPQYLSAPFPNI